jgi:DNA (cytosine-5)-methyltransferase 1
MERANVDTTETITHVGLCAGYGGIELGLKRVLPTLRSVALCEIEAFAIANLVAKMEAGLMDAAPVWTDLKTFPWESFRDRVDVLTGGYPCQPFSAAGKRAGKDDPRHLWPWIADGIAAMRPKLCFFENVEGHISLGLSDVIEDLAGMGYRTTWGIFSAAECGAPHQRKRVFIMAHRNGKGLERYDQLLTGFHQSRWDSSQSQGQVNGSDCCGISLANANSNGGGESWSLRKRANGPKFVCNGEQRRDVWPSRPGQPQHAWEPPRVVANPRCGERGGREIEQGPECSRKSKFREAGEGMGNASNTGHTGTEGQGGAGAEGQSDGHFAEPTGDNQHEIEPTLGGDVDGTADRLDDAELYVTYDNRTDELRLLGNGVVPACAALAFTTLLNEQRNTRHLA